MKRLFVPPELFEFHDIVLRSRPLSARIMDDITSHPDSSVGDIHGRIGPQMPRHRIAAALVSLRKAGKIHMRGTRRGARYVRI